MWEPVQIANAALAKLGDVPLNALPPRAWTPAAIDDPRFARDAALYSEVAQMAGSTYYIHRDAMLAHPWAFALRRSKLDRRPSNEAHRYPNLFWLPEGSRFLGLGVRAIYTSAEATNPRVDNWTRERDGISALYDEVWGEWIEDVDEDQWPPLVVDALVLRLCSEWAFYVTDQANLTELYAQKAEEALNKAKRFDAQARPSQGTQDFSLVQARFRRGYSRLSRQYGG